MLQSRSRKSKDYDLLSFNRLLFDLTFNLVLYHNPLGDVLSEKEIDAKNLSSYFAIRGQSA